jgi:hypothetical protein
VGRISAAAALTRGIPKEHRAAIRATLELFPPHILELTRQRGIKVRVLTPGQLYRQVSPLLERQRIDVDQWPVPPAGLFVVDERTLYLRETDRFTVAHEFGHAIDCALGGGEYFSFRDVAQRERYASARRFVSPYAATGHDEYFAECCRAYVEGNPEGERFVMFPLVSKAILREKDPEMFSFLDMLFTEPVAAPIAA